MAANTDPLGPFLGLNNRLSTHALHVDRKGDFLAAVDNLDVDVTGRLITRSGYTVAQAMTAPHSMFGNLLVRSAALYSFATSPTYSETLLAILTNDNKVCYAEHNGAVYFSNGTDSGRIENGVVYPWALLTPDAPSCTAIAGTLPAGKYQVAVSYYNHLTGEEGGVSASTNHELTTAGAIQATLPAATTGATKVRVYVSKLNGDVPGLYSTVATGTATADITSTTTTATANLQYVEPLPAGTRIFTHMGRLCSVSGKYVYYGEAYRFGYYKPHRGYLAFEADVTMAASNQMALFIAADKTFRLLGDLEQPENPVADVLPYGAVPGTEFVLPQNSLVGWFGEKGFVLGTPQGEVEAPMTETVTPTLPATGCAYVFEDAPRRVYSCGYCMNVETKAVTTYSNFAFTSMSNGLGTLPAGLYALSGITDAGVDVSWTADFGKIDFKSEALKHLTNVYVGGISAEPVSLRVTLPDDTYYEYDAREASSAGVDIQRIDTGRGLRANWFGLELYGTTPVVLTSVSFLPVATSRRI